MLHPLYNDHEYETIKSAPVHVFVKVCWNILLAIVQVAFGFLFIIADDSFEHINPMVFAALKLFICSIVLHPLAFILEKREGHKSVNCAPNCTEKEVLKSRLPTLKETFYLVGAGMALSINQIAIIVGYYYTTPYVTTLFNPITIVSTAVISVLLKNEKLSIWKLLGVFIAVSGSMCVSLSISVGREQVDDNTLQLSWFTVYGCVCLLVNVFSYGLFFNFQARCVIKKSTPPITVSAWSSTVACILTSIAALPSLPSCDFRSTTWQSWYTLLYAGTLGSSLLWTLSIVATKHLKPTMTIVHVSSLPIWTGALSFVLQNELLPWYTWVGSTLVVSGIIFVACAKGLDKHVQEQQDLQKEKEHQHQQETLSRIPSPVIHSPMPSSPNKSLSPPSPLSDHVMMMMMNNNHV
ncbi:hypothetical protein AKO1_015023 [Acrasis kona]|uniref:EamA domain-containing protein n=1 Tax=Acrasis kona TaxID=1008807 RepID=A0AAW2Z1M2_9EUKA